MVNSAVDMYNLALSSIGARSDVQATDEMSPGAEECTRWYETVVDSVLRAAPWPSATAFARLAQVAVADRAVDWTSLQPPPAWAYEFALPGDIIRPRYTTSFGRFDLSSRGTTHTLVTNEAAVILAYTKRQHNVNMWDEQLRTAIAHALGAHIALKLTGKTSRANRALEVANDLVMQARLSAANEVDQQQYDAVPSWMEIRGATSRVAQSQYYYPNGALISLPS